MISHDHQLIFVHYPRTGGSSIEFLFEQPMQDTVPLSILVHRYGQETCDNYYKFTIVRNPFDWFVSSYFYFKDRPVAKGKLPIVRQDETFKEYIDNCYEKTLVQGLGMKQQYDWHVSNGSLNVDQVIRFEEYETQVPMFLFDYGIEVPIPHINKTEDRLAYAEYYDLETKNKVMAMCEPDLDYFQYAF